MAKMVHASNSDEVLEMMYEILEEIGFEDVIIVASKGRGEKFASLIRGVSTKQTIAQIGMAIKEVALEMDIPSNELADKISKHLKEAEEKFAEFLEKQEKEEKKGKKVKKIDIIVN